MKNIPRVLFWLLVLIAGRALTWGDPIDVKTVALSGDGENDPLGFINAPIISTDGYVAYKSV